jgi:hypothetical protein
VFAVQNGTGCSKLLTCRNEFSVCHLEVDRPIADGLSRMELVVQNFSHAGMNSVYVI